VSLRKALQDAVIAGLKAVVPTTTVKAKNIKAAVAIDSSMPVILVTVDEKQLDCQVFDDLRMMVVEIRILTRKEEDDEKVRLHEVVEAVDAYYRTPQDFGTLDGYKQVRAAQMLRGGIMDEDNDRDWNQAAGHFLVPFEKSAEASPSGSASASA
jgi:hypothetical protein